MKKQFAIKSVQTLKAVSKLVAKSESVNVLRFLGDGPCCSEWDLTPTKIVALR